MLPVLYGIKNCDTVKKARNWLAAHDVDHQFHDFRSDGLSAADLTRFASLLGWQVLLNRNSTTWRQLDPSQQSLLISLNESTNIAPDALELVLNSPTLLKRPILDSGNELVAGFKTEEYERLFGK